MRSITENEVTSILSTHFLYEQPDGSDFGKLVLLLNSIAALNGCDNNLMDKYVSVQLETFIQAIYPQMYFKDTVWKVIEIKEEYVERLTSASRSELDDESVELFNKFQPVHYYASDLQEVRNLNTYLLHNDLKTAPKNSENIARNDLIKAFQHPGKLHEKAHSKVI